MSAPASSTDVANPKGEKADRSGWESSSLFQGRGIVIPLNDLRMSRPVTAVSTACLALLMSNWASLRTSLLVLVTLVKSYPIQRSPASASSVSPRKGISQLPHPIGPM